MFTIQKCITEINNKQLHNPQDIDIVVLMYNFILYSNDYSKNLKKFILVLQRWNSFKEFLRYC